jgi:cytochrome c556
MSTIRLIALVGVGLIALAASHGFGQPPKQKEKDVVDVPLLPSEAQIMQAKLRHAQALMAALAKENYDKLEEHAAALAAISKASDFLRAYKSEEYEFQARAFQRSAETIVEKARKKNIDGATLAFLDMNISCVGCHNHYRGRTKN